MSSTSLKQIQPGDTVTLKRNLDHPAWMREVKADPRDGGGTRRVHDTTVEEIIGELVVTERDQSRVRLSNSFWYLVEDGTQERSSATLIA